MAASDWSSPSSLMTQLQLLGPLGRPRMGHGRLILHMLKSLVLGMLDSFFLILFAPHLGRSSYHCVHLKLKESSERTFYLLH